MVFFIYVQQNKGQHLRSNSSLYKISEDHMPLLPYAHYIHVCLHVSITSSPHSLSKIYRNEK